MHMFTTRKTEPDVPAAPAQYNRTSMPTGSGGLLSKGVSIRGSVKFGNELLVDGEVEGIITSTGILTIGEHARIHGEIRVKSVKGRGSVKGDIFLKIGRSHV